MLGVLASSVVRVLWFVCLVSCFFLLVFVFVCWCWLVLAGAGWSVMQWVGWLCIYRFSYDTRFSLHVFGLCCIPGRGVVFVAVVLRCVLMC